MNIKYLDLYINQIMHPYVKLWCNCDIPQYCINAEYCLQCGARIPIYYSVDKESWNRFLTWMLRFTLVGDIIFRRRITNGPEVFVVYIIEHRKSPKYEWMNSNFIGEGLSKEIALLEAAVKFFEAMKPKYYKLTLTK